MATGLSLRIRNTATNACVDRTFARFPVRIGRTSLNDLTIVDPFVSQFHAIIELHGNELMLRDLGSSNGTRVGDNRAPPHETVPLAPHSGRFAIGPLAIEVSLVEVEEAVASVAAAAQAAVARHEDDVLDDSFVTQLTATVAFDGAMLEEVRARFGGVAPGSPPGAPQDANPAAKQNLGGTLVLDASAFAKQRDAAFARAREQAQLSAEAKRQTLERLALQGVREIARAFLPQGKELEEPEDLVRFLSKLRDTIDVFLRCFIPLRDGYRQFTSQMHIQRGANDNRVETAQTEQELASHLLDWTQRGSDGHKAIEGTFADLMIHQLALLHAIMRGVKSLLDALSPRAVDGALEEMAAQGKANFAWGPWRFKELWRVYTAKHGDMDDGDKRMFAALFGPDFAESYRQYRGTVDSPDS